MHGLGRPFINRSSEFYCVASPVLSHAMEMWMFAGMMSIEGTLKTECVRRSFIFQSCSLKRLKLKLIKMLFGIKLFVFVVYFISYLGIPITQPLGRQVCVVVTFFHAQSWNKAFLIPLFGIQTARHPEAGSCALFDVYSQCWQRKQTNVKCYKSEIYRR